MFVSYALEPMALLTVKTIRCGGGGGGGDEVGLHHDTSTLGNGNNASGCTAHKIVKERKRKFNGNVLVKPDEDEVHDGYHKLK